MSVDLRRQIGGLLSRPRRPPVRDAGAPRALPRAARPADPHACRRPSGHVRSADIWSDSSVRCPGDHPMRRDPLCRTVSVHEIVGTVEGRVRLARRGDSSTPAAPSRRPRRSRRTPRSASSWRRPAQCSPTPGRDPAVRRHRPRRRDRHAPGPAREAVGPTVLPIAPLLAPSTRSSTTARCRARSTGRPDGGCHGEPWLRSYAPGVPHELPAPEGPCTT